MSRTPQRRAASRTGAPLPVTITARRSAGRAILIAWHSASSPSRVQRALALPEERLAAIERAVSTTYGEVERRELGNVTAFVASR